MFSGESAGFRNHRVRGICGFRNHRVRGISAASGGFRKLTVGCEAPPMFWMVYSPQRQAIPTNRTDVQSTSLNTNRLNPTPSAAERVPLCLFVLLNDFRLRIEVCCSSPRSLGLGSLQTPPSPEDSPHLQSRCTSSEPHTHIRSHVADYGYVSCIGKKFGS